jgi:predicted nucleic acid-binding Zn ribbon protein
MERAARVIQKSKHSRQVLADDDLARAAWPSVVGKAIAAHTSNVRLVRSTLVVEVEDAIWQRQLHALTSQIVDRFRKLTGNDAVDDAEFRISVPRRRPQRVESPRSAHTVDAEEADRIEDPVLRKIYRMSQRRAAG